VKRWHYYYAPSRSAEYCTSAVDTWWQQKMRTSAVKIRPMDNNWHFLITMQHSA